MKTGRKNGGAATASKSSAATDAGVAPTDAGVAPLDAGVAPFDAGVARTPSTRKILIKGNAAIAEAAVRAGCDFYAGYPITPQNEIPEYMSRRLPEAGGIFIQAESEIAAINMVYGAAAAGFRAMTSSSSPGISLKQEGISMLAGAELPAVIVNVQRGGPGLGNISGAQSDYFQAVKGGGHGDYRMLVYAPYNVQEMWDLTMLAFDRADLYRNPVMILADGILGQMMEPFVPTPYVRPELPDKPWALSGCKGRPQNVIRTLYMDDGHLERINNGLQEKYALMKRREVLCQTQTVEDAEVVIVAFGSAARISWSAVKELRRAGIKAGLFRPITLFPFPENEISALAQGGPTGSGTAGSGPAETVPSTGGTAGVRPAGRVFLVVELNAGQMVEDVRLAVNGRAEVFFHGRPGGAAIEPTEIVEAVMRLVAGKRGGGKTANGKTACGK
jgi:2-oxoglutarate ferredoxin oxidoreductase subunit alpha